jgi:hypothetical protein
VKKSEAAEIVLMLVNAYPNWKLGERTCEVYESRLLDLDRAAAHRAVTRIMDTSRFPPTIAEIREACAAISVGAVRGGGEAWLDVMAEIRRAGGYGRPRFRDPIIAGIIADWGWARMCWEGMIDADRARFIDMYESIAARQRADVQSGIALPDAPARRALEAVK